MSLCLLKQSNYPKNLERLNLIFLKLCPLYLFVSFNSFKSKYLNFFFYLFDCQVSCALSPCMPSSSFGYLPSSHREMLLRFKLSSLDFCLPGLRASRPQALHSYHLHHRETVVMLSRAPLDSWLRTLCGGRSGWTRTIDLTLIRRAL